MPARVGLVRRVLNKLQGPGEREGAFRRFSVSRSLANDGSNIPQSTKLFLKPFVKH